jgi:phosphopantetheinyl transferase (holo-ACP synthase)
MPDLGPREVVLAARLAWPPRRDAWVAGRAVAKAALFEAFALASWRVEILPAASGAPEVHVDGARRADLHVSISHTRHCAVAAVSIAPVGVDACDDDDGPRLPRIARRVFDEGEAEACHAHASPATQAAVWALKEAGVKLHGGGVLTPGLRSVRVESLEPPRVTDPSMHVALYRLPHTAVAVARAQAGPR